MGHFTICQIAADRCRIRTLCFQRTSIQTAAGDLHLTDCSIRFDGDRFRASLSGECRIMGLAVIEDVVLSIDILNTAMVGTGRVKPVFRLSSVDTDVTV